MNFDPLAASEKPASPPAARPLIPLTLALALGVAGAAWGFRLSGLVLAVGLSALFAILILIWLTKRVARLMPLALFGLLGLALAQQALHPAFPPHHVAHLPQEQEISLRGRVYLPPQVQEERVRLFLEADAWRSPQGWRSAAGNVLVTVSLPTPALPEGCELVVRTALRAFRDPLNPGAFPRSRYWASQDVFREARLKEPADLVVLAAREPPALRERLREGLRRRLAPMEQIPRALYLALILGDQGEISQPMRQVFSRTGTTHILSISGLHLAMLAGLGFVVSFWLLRRFPWILLRINAVKLATVLAAAPVVAYAWVAGGSPATQRAEIMILAYLFLVLLGRPREAPSALALAALVILALSPLLLFALSFQLSFLSVAALIYLLPRWATPPDPEARSSSPWQKWGRRAVFWVKGALLTSLVATLATAPLVAASFHLVSILGVLVNLAAIPLMNGLAVPVGLLALAAESLHLTPLAHGLLHLGQYPLKAAYAAISWAAALPGSAVVLPTPSWLQISLYYALALLVFPPQRTVRTWGAAVVAGAILVASVAALFTFRSQACELTVLDSATGLSGVLVTPDDRRLVISAGWPAWPGREGGSMGPLPGYLHWRQFRRLDLVLALSLTSRNAPELLRTAQEFRLQEAWFAGGGRGGEVIALRNFLGDRGQPARSLRRGEAPPALGAAKLAYYELERGGMALGLTYAGRRVALFPPAGPAANIDQVIAEGPLDVLVVSRQPPREWLSALNPGFVVMYGRPEKSQPDPQSLPKDRFLSTREGAVTLKLAPQGLTVSQWRPWGAERP
jgi:competence protein ComEC